METVGNTTLVAAPGRQVERLFTGGRAADLRVAGVLMAAGGLMLPLGPDIDLPLCPLRALTGVPCPFCGMTTAGMAAAHGDLVGAVAANPASLVLMAAIAASFAPMIYRDSRVHAAAARWRPWLTRLPWLALPLLWLWQLDRFGFI